MTTTEYLQREIRRTELSVRRAERKPNTQPEELRGLHEKLEHLQDALYYEELDAGLSLRAWNTRHAPPIGRCGECKHSTNPAALTMIYGEPGTLTCHHGPCNRRNVNENDFCSYFEPKED